MTPCIEHHQPVGTHGGYGSIQHEGRVRAWHRVAYCKANGVSIDSIDGVLVRHKCDNRRCINPAHLELGTHADNSMDMRQRGGMTTRALTQEQVDYCRKVYVPRSREFSFRALARQLGTNRTTIELAVKGKTYAPA